MLVNLPLFKILRRVSIESASNIDRYIIDETIRDKSGKILENYRK